MLRLRSAMLLPLGILIFLGCERGGSDDRTASAATPAPLCDETTARLVARAYVLSIPLSGKEDDLIPLMGQNPAYFTQGGDAIRCMRGLGTALAQGGLRTAQTYGGYSATEQFGASMPEGLSHLPGEVDASMNSYGSDMLAMGQELQWLSRVLPLLAMGDYSQYNTPATPSRQMAAQALVFYQLLCQMDPAICQVMQNMTLQAVPFVEQQVHSLARQVG